MRVVFEYNHLEVEWYGNHTFNVYAIDECGVRDQALDCFTNINPDSRRKKLRSCRL